MFSLGGAIRELQNAAGMAGGVDFGARVGWNDPNSWWTPERRAFFAKNPGPSGPAYQRTFNGGDDAPTTAGSKDGLSVAAGYNALDSKPKPRAARSAMAGLQRQAARNMAGKAGWGAGGYK